MYEGLENAIIFATTLHTGQRYEKFPYILHPLRVMLALKSAGVTEPDVLTAAVLHDVIEDTDTRFSEVEVRFGSRVATLVMVLTRSPDVDYFSYVKNVRRNTVAAVIKRQDILDHLSNNPSQEQITRYTRALRLLDQA